jgi:hypothetical protein
MLILGSHSFASKLCCQVAANLLDSFLKVIAVSKRVGLLRHLCTPILNIFEHQVEQSILLQERVFAQ